MYVEKPCPKNAFLGLCEEGLVKGVPRGEYTKSEKNKKYALKAFEKLQEDPLIKNDIKEFWRIVGPKPTISHNYQLNVVSTNETQSSGYKEIQSARMTEGLKYL